MLRTPARLNGALGFAEMAPRNPIAASLAILAAVLVLALLVGRIPSRTLEKPPLPYIDTGACPFECCTYTQWVANESVQAFSDPTDNPRLAFRVKKGDRVDAQTGFVVTKRPGEIYVERTYQLDGEYDPVKPDQPHGPTIPAGGHFYVLHYQGEGYSLVWYEGRTYSEMVPLSTKDSPDNGMPADYPIKLRREALSDWWIRIESEDGQIGWVRNPPSFKYADACGGET